MSILFTLTLCYLAPSTLLAQFGDDIYIYGFSQTLYLEKKFSFDITPNPLAGPLPAITDGSFRNNNFTAQQVNLFFSKNFEDNYTFFLNFAAIGSYETRFNSGEFGVQEAWVNYRKSDAFQVKVGQMLPVFNNLNEIQNRLALFPYALRPFIYEGFYNFLFQPEDYIPQRAFLQIQGNIPFGNYQFDYSVHMGNAEPSYNSKTEPGQGFGGDEESSTLYRGEEVSRFHSFGARVGLRNRNESLKFGISGTYDRDNRISVTTESLSRFPVQVIPALGNVKRYRVGADFSFYLDRVSFESELIMVFHGPPENEIPGVTVNLNKMFAYASTTYNFTPKLYAFTLVSFIKNNSYNYILPDSPESKGLLHPEIGMGYRINDVMVIKQQYSHGFLLPNPYLDLKVQMYTLALSVLF